MGRAGIRRRKPRRRLKPLSDHDIERRAAFATVESKRRAFGVGFGAMTRTWLVLTVILFVGMLWFGVERL